ncbi:cytochrome c oxidase assembly protein [Goodfellowiella coeruleoviolacea]|uniref:cytochrome c oxidase assembly protein n=1 Tax=Goodfellowiella coeruleoviolacea TaxID=334858 RepID=UPI0020A3AF2E|nr:cytochrome c oxidase assembly protein [Goodfellowiella coeruleoviolacea]
MRIDRAAVLAGGIGVAGVLLVVVVAGDVHAPLGDSDPGRLASLLFGLIRFASDAAGVVVVGALAFAAFAVPSTPDGRLSADAFASVCLAAGAAVVWVVAALAAVPLSAGDASGQPPGVVWANLPALVDATEEPKAWLCVAALALVVAVAARQTLTWRAAVLCFAVAVLGLLPPVVAGHVSVGAWHDVATNAMVWHVPAAGVWVGALLALRSFLRRPGAPHRQLVLRRYHRMSAVCLVVLVLSGAVTGLALARPAGLATGFGALLLLKVTVCAVVLLLRRGWAGRWPVGTEVVALGVATGGSVALTHLVPPAFTADPPSVAESLMGYELTAAPDPAALLLDWRPDLLVGLGSVLLAGAYLAGVRVLRRRGVGWPVRRTAAWLAGCLLVLVASSSGIGRYAPGMFSVHMAAHMVLNMFAPVLLALGGPVTLALRTLPRAPRGWLVALLHSGVARLVAHPAVAAVGFVASFYVLYFSGLFGAAMFYHWAHQLMNVHFLVSGYVFYWLVIGVDRPPRPLPHLARLGMLFAVMPFHAFFGVILMNSPTVVAETYYRYLALPWVPDPLADQRVAGGIAWAAGEIPMLVVVIALLAQWAAADRREATRVDRRVDSGADDRLAAYNAMLADLAGPRHQA